MGSGWERYGRPLKSMGSPCISSGNTRVIPDLTRVISNRTGVIPDLTRVANLECKSLEMKELLFWYIIFHPLTQIFSMPDSCSMQAVPTLRSRISGGRGLSKRNNCHFARAIHDTHK